MIILIITVLTILTPTYVRGHHEQDIGVYVQKDIKSVYAVWKERSGKSRTRTFPWSKFATPKDAYEAAVKYRNEQNERVLTEIAAAQRDDTRHVQERYVPKPQTNKTGRKYVRIRYREGRSPNASAIVVIDGVRYTKTFTASFFDDDIDKAADAAYEWAKDIREVKGKKRERNE